MRYIDSFRFHSSSANGSQLLFVSIRNFFFFSPDPLLPALPCLTTSNNPPPPGRGTRRPVSVRSSRRRHDSPASLLHDRSLTMFVRYCPFLFASACFSSFPLFYAHLRCFAPRLAARYGKRRADFVSSALRSPPASIDMGKAGRGYRCRFLPVPPVSPFRLPCLLAAFSFPYLPGMVMGYSVATVIYFS